ncbi:GNAT family N-acetyltransferase [Herbidospora daliensis]|uniref:GNAT family N-acetyltransferase n=1 Tax=Herbidospora daliensis TaxID=295585 RepID=UPI000782DA23|nr:GNAT family N-acetyltransferase [Herbidospora daliensis]
MDIRDLGEDDLDAVLDNRKRAFGPLSASDAAIWRRMVTPLLSQGRCLGVFDGARLVATARLNPFTQWWHGRPQSMGGVAGVTVAPEDRGRGVGRMLMSAVLDRCSELGSAVSALYPATTPVYRNAGFEHAGGRLIATLPTEALRTIAPGAPAGLRRMGPGDTDELVALIGRVHAATRASGPLTYTPETWRVWLEDDDDFCYLADDGYVIYRWSGGDIEVDGLLAASEATARALWALVGTSSSVAKRVTATIAPDDPVLWLLRERSTDVVASTRWMFRLVDPADAIARRGYPAAVTAAVTFELTDPARPANDGTWLLEVADGTGALSKGAGPGPALTINALSALYAGVPAATLRMSGGLTGPALFDDTLDAVFAAKAYLLDYF